MANGRVGQRAVRRRRNRARECAVSSGRKTLVQQSNKSLVVGGLSRGFFLLRILHVARLFFILAI